MGVPYANVCEREPCIKIWLHRGKDRLTVNICVPTMVCVVQHTLHNPSGWNLNKDSQPFWLKSQQGLPDQSQVDGFLMDGPYKEKVTFLS